MPSTIRYPLLSFDYQIPVTPPPTGGRQIERYGRKSGRGFVGVRVGVQIFIFGSIDRYWRGGPIDRYWQDQYTSVL